MTLLAVLVALLATVLYTMASAMQQRANLVSLRRAAAGDASAAGAGAAVAVARQPMWIWGLFLNFGGFGLQAVALSLAAISLVQPVLAVGVVLMVPAGAWVVGGHVTRNEWLSASLVVVGIGLFVVLAHPSPGIDQAPPLSWLAVILICGAVLALLMLIGRTLAPYRAALFGCAAGVWTGMLGAVIKQATGDVNLKNWALYGVVVFGLLNIFWINVAMRAGRLATAQAALNAVQPVVALVIGVTIFQETLTADAAAFAGALAGVAIAGYGIARLARSPSLLALGEAAAQ